MAMTYSMMNDYTDIYKLYLIEDKKRNPILWISFFSILFDLFF